MAAWDGIKRWAIVNADPRSIADRLSSEFLVPLFTIIIKAGCYHMVKMLLSRFNWVIYISVDTDVGAFDLMCGASLLSFKLIE